MKKDILIIIPAHNEEKNLPEVIKKIRNSIQEANILVIDDCSTDNTKNKLRDLNVNFIHLPVNLGYGGAVQTGLKYAVEKGYPLIVLLDGDGQHEPSEIPKLLRKLEENNLDLVIGSRFKDNYHPVYSIPFFRKLGMIFFSRITSLLIHQKMRDTTSGFQVFNNKVASILSEIYPSDFPDAQVIILLKKLSFKIGEVQVKMHQRQTGKSMITFFKSIYYPFRIFLSIFIILLRLFIMKFSKEKNV